jgi:hypothetical protein
MATAADSGEAGFLLPRQPPAPLFDDDWDDFLHDFFAGIVGFDPTLVRPRWEPEPAPRPDIDTDWCAFGVMSTTIDFDPAIVHIPALPPTAGSTWDNGASSWDAGASTWDAAASRAAAGSTWDNGATTWDNGASAWDVAAAGNGYDALQTHQIETILCSFYGPSGDRFSSYLQRGIFLDQNRQILRANSAGLVEVSGVTRTAELIKERWWPRSDINVILRREIRYDYNVRNLVQSRGTITAQPPGETRLVEDDFDTGQAAAAASVWDGGASVWDNGATTWD